jgi:hypothetical protein
MASSQVLPPTYILPNQLGDYFVDAEGGGGGGTTLGYYLGQNADFIQLYRQPDVGPPVFVNQANIATTTTVADLVQRTKNQTTAPVGNATTFNGTVTATGEITGASLTLSAVAPNNVINNVGTLNWLNGANVSPMVTYANANAPGGYGIRLNGQDIMNNWYKYAVPAGQNIIINGGQLTSPDGVNLTFAGNVLTPANTANWANFPAVNNVIVGQDYANQRQLLVNNFVYNVGQNYGNSVINTNLRIGQQSLTKAPDVEIYPEDFNVGSALYRARSIGLYTGVEGTSIYSLGAVDIEGDATNVSATGVLNLSADGAVLVEGGADINLASVGAITMEGPVTSVLSEEFNVTSGLATFENATSFSILSPATTITGLEASIIPTGTLNLTAPVTNVIGAGNLNIASPLTTITGAVVANNAITNNITGATLYANMATETYITSPTTVLRTSAGGARTELNMTSGTATLLNNAGGVLTFAGTSATLNNTGAGNVSINSTGGGDIVLNTNSAGKLRLTNPIATNVLTNNIYPETFNTPLRIFNNGGANDIVTLNNVATITSVAGMTMSNVASIINPSIALNIQGTAGGVTVQSTSAPVVLRSVTNDVTIAGRRLIVGATEQIDFTVGGGGDVNMTANLNVSGDVTGVNATFDNLTTTGFDVLSDMTVNGNLDVIGALVVSGGEIVTGPTIFNTPVVFNNSVETINNTLFNIQSPEFSVLTESINIGIDEKIAIVGDISGNLFLAGQNEAVLYAGSNIDIFNDVNDTNTININPGGNFTVAGKLFVNGVTGNIQLDGNTSVTANTFSASSGTATTLSGPVTTGSVVIMNGPVTVNNTINTNNNITTTQTVTAGNIQTAGTVTANVFSGLSADDILTLAVYTAPGENSMSFTTVSPNVFDVTTTENADNGAVYSLNALYDCYPLEITIITASTEWAGINIGAYDAPTTGFLNSVIAFSTDPITGRQKVALGTSHIQDAPTNLSSTVKVVIPNATGTGCQYFIDNVLDYTFNLFNTEFIPPFRLGMKSLIPFGQRDQSYRITVNPTSTQNGSLINIQNINNEILFANGVTNIKNDLLLNSTSYVIPTTNVPVKPTLFTQSVTVNLANIAGGYCQGTGDIFITSAVPGATFNGHFLYESWNIHYNVISWKFSPNAGALGGIESQLCQRPETPGGTDYVYMIRTTVTGNLASNETAVLTYSIMAFPDVMTTQATAVPII